jgi:hypothetical protein
MRGETSFSFEYQKLNSKDQKTVRRWLGVNAVVVAVLLAGLIVVASKFSGSESAATAETAAVDTQARLTAPP